MKTHGFICRVPGRDTHPLTRPGNARSGVTCDASPRIASLTVNALCPLCGQANSAFINDGTLGSQHFWGIFICFFGTLSIRMPLISDSTIQNQACFKQSISRSSRETMPFQVYQGQEIAA